MLVNKHTRFSPHSHFSPPEFLPPPILKTVDAAVRTPWNMNTFSTFSPSQYLVYVISCSCMIIMPVIVDRKWLLIGSAKISL